MAKTAHFRQYLGRMFQSALVALILLLSNAAYSQLIPPDSTTYWSTDQSGRVVPFHRPKDSLMIPGKVLVHFRQGALDSLIRSTTYADWYGGYTTKQKHHEQPLSGPTYGGANDQRGFPDGLRSLLFAERFYFDSSNNIVKDAALKSFLATTGGHYPQRLTTASPIDTLSITRTGDTTGCDHANWMILTLDSTENPLLVSYLLLASYQRDIVGAWPDYKGGMLCGHPPDTAGDTKYISCQLNTEMINAETAWWYEVGDTSIIVGVTDAGVDYRHPDFGDSILGQGHKFQVGWSWDGFKDTVYKPSPGHGTQMAEILGALTNNMLGSPIYDQSVAGVAGGWGMLLPHPINRGRGVTIDVATSDINVNGQTGMIAGIFEESARSPYSPYGWGVHALNISEGTPPGFDPFSPLHACINYAFENGVAICAAMHESGAVGDSTTGWFPALYEEPWVIAVGGSTPGPIYKSKIAQSDYGRTMDIIAPAGSTAGCGASDEANYTTHADVPGSFNFLGSGGTSAACANTTGSVALLLSHFHRIDTVTFQHVAPEDYQGIIKASAWRGDAFRLANTSLLNAWDDSTGWGHLDIGRAFQMLDSDRTQYAFSAYKLYHYHNSNPTSMTFGSWIAAPSGNNSFGPSYDPNMTQFPDTIATYGHRNFQLGYFEAKANYRIVKLTMNLPDIWDRSDTVPLFAWGTSGGSTSKTGWNLSSPFN